MVTGGSEGAWSRRSSGITARGTVTPSGTQSVPAPGYDSAGNLTTDQSYGYVYDGRGHMCAAHTAQGMVGYIYDAQGIGLQL